MSGKPVPETETTEPEVIYVGHRRAYIRRLGCGCGVLLWILIMLIPGFLLLLAIQGEVALWHGGDIPEPAAHPRLQVKLIMEATTRGVSVTTSSQTTQPDNLTCVQTDVRYILWQGQGNDVTYCDCYTRADSVWEFVSTNQGQCKR